MRTNRTLFEWDKWCRAKARIAEELEASITKEQLEAIIKAFSAFPRLAGRKAMLRWNVGEGFPRCAMRMTRIAITLSNRSPYARPGNGQTARGRSRRNIILSYSWRCIRWRWWLLGWKPGSYLGTHLRSRYQWDGLLSAGCSLAPMPSSPRRFPPPWIVEDHLACFIVKDRTGQALAHIY